MIIKRKPIYGPREHWFAWRPVRTVDGDIVWREWVQRRQVYNYWQYTL